MEKQIITLIGGPGAGKSTIINKLLEKGYCCYPEISRDVTLEAKKNGTDQLFLENPILFSELLLQGRIKQYQDAQKESHQIVFLDRGIPDVLAYMEFIGDHFPDYFHQACKENVYSKIFVLPPWEDIYISDNERYEDYNQAVEIYHYLMKTYQKYGYNIVEVPRDTVENRVNFILERI